MSEDQVSKEIPGTLEAVSVLLFDNDNKKVLLVKHTSEAQNEEGIYGLPGGKIELGESPREAAKRELMEETGLITEEESLEQFEGNYFGAYIIRTKGGTLRHAHMRVFRSKSFEGELKGDEKTMPEWVEVEKLEELNKMPNVYEAVNNYLLSLKPQNNA